MNTLDLTMDETRGGEKAAGEEPVQTDDCRRENGTVIQELREAVLNGCFVKQHEFRDLAKLAGLTDEMLKAAEANFQHRESYEPEEWAIKRAYVAMQLLSDNPNTELVNAAHELMQNIKHPM